MALSLDAEIAFVQRQAGRGAAMSPVDPQAFVTRMDAKWQEYGNVGSPALDAVWQRIAETLNRQTTTPSLPRPVIPAELGAGKTTCAKLWCSMLPSEGHPGVLIVVRTIAQANEYANDINAWSGSPTAALAHHSDVKPRPAPSRIAQAPTLVICHRGYELALDKLLVEEAERYEELMRFRDCQRRLAIVDEALDQVYVAQLSLDQFPQVLGLVRDPRILKRHLGAVDVINSAYRALLGAPNDGLHVVSTDVLLARTTLSPAEADAALVALWEEVRTSKYVKPEARHVMKETLTALRRHLAAYRWTESERKHRALVGSRLLLPPDAGQVILDATGALNNVYLGRPDAYEVQPMAPVRDYRAVTLHVARTKGTGKWAMRKHGERIATEARDAVLARYGIRAASRRVLAVTNLDSESTVRAVWATAPLAALDVAHWNRIDGRNEWRDYDTLVILTLPWAKTSLDVSTFTAVREVELDDEGLNAPPDEVRTIRETRIAAQLAQAMGRIRLRRMTSEDGTCEPCDVFIRFPHSFGVILDTDHVLAGLQRVLTGISVVSWDAASAPRSRDGRPPAVGQRLAGELLTMAGVLSPGDRLPLTRKLFPSAMFYVVLAEAQRQGSPLQAALADLGARVAPGGHRPGTSGRVPAELVRS